MKTKECQLLEYSVQYKLGARKRNCTCDQNMNDNLESNVGVQKNTQTGKAIKATKCHSNKSNKGYRGLSWSYSCRSRSPGVFSGSEKLKVTVWIMAALFILMKRSNGFPQGTSIVANFEQTYCQPQVAALNRAPNHVDPRLCGGTCTPRPVADGRYTIQVNTTVYSIHNVQVDIQASSGANILGFAVVAVTERNVTAGRWVIQDNTNPTVVRATCDALLQGQVIFHARASRERDRVTVIWDSRRTNFGRIFFRAWVVQRHSQIFVLDSEPLTNRLNASAFVSLESKFRDVISGISVQQSTAGQQSESGLVNSTTQVPSTTSVTQSSAPSPTSTRLTQNSTQSSTSPSVTQQPEMTPPTPTPSSVTQQQESLPISSSTPTLTLSNVNNPTNVTDVAHAQPESHKTNHSPNSNRNMNTITNVDNARMPPLVSLKEFEEAFNSRMSNGYKINDEDPFEGFNRASYQLTDFIPESNARRLSNTSLDPFRIELVFEANGRSESRDIQSTNGVSNSQISEQTAGQGSLPGSFAGQNLGFLADQLQGGPRPFPGAFSGQFPSQFPLQQQGQFPGLFPFQQQGQFPSQSSRQQQGQFSGQSPLQQQGQFPGLFPFQQQGQFPSQSSLQQQGQFPGQSPLQQQGQFPGLFPFQQQGQFPSQAPSLQQQGQFPGQSPLQQGQFPGQSPFQQQGQFPGQSPFQQQGQFPSLFPFQQQGQSPNQSLLQQQGQFPGQSPLQQQGHFPGLFPFQQQGQFPGQSPLQQWGQFPGQSPLQPWGQFPGQSPFRQQGQFPGQPAFQQQGQFPGQTALQQQGQFPGQPAFQQQGQFPGLFPFQQQGQFPGLFPFQQQGLPGQPAFQQQGHFPGLFPFQQQGQFSSQSPLQQQGQFPGHLPWIQQGQFPNPAQRQAVDLAVNNPGSNQLNILPNQAQIGSSTSGLGAFGENLQLQALSNAMTTQGNTLQNPNGGMQTNQFRGFFNMFGGSPTSRWQRNSLSAGRMFG